MLERMRVQNFQRHRDFRIEFDPRITVLVGSSDTGKSAILRALRWVMTGKPFGSSFIRHGEKEAVVTLWLDGYKLVRRKGKNVNEILLDGRRLEAFGSETPEPVSRLCNVDDTNFQDQHDPPFWLSLTAGQASRELNAVVNLDEIDRVMSAILKEERKAKLEVEIREKELNEANRELESLAWVKDMEAEWTEVESLQDDLADAEEELLLIEGLLKEVEELQARAKVEVPDTEEIDRQIAELTQIEKEEKEALALLEEVDSLRRQITDIDKQIDELQRELEKRSGGICPLCGGVLSCQR